MVIKIIFNFLEDSTTYRLPNVSVMCSNGEISETNANGEALFEHLDQGFAYSFSFENFEKILNPINIYINNLGPFEVTTSEQSFESMNSSMTLRSIGDRMLKKFSFGEEGLFIKCINIQPTTGTFAESAYLLAGNIMDDSSIVCTKLDPVSGGTSFKFAYLPDEAFNLINPDNGSPIIGVDYINGLVSSTTSPRVSLDNFNNIRLIDTSQFGSFCLNLGIETPYDMKLQRIVNYCKDLSGYSANEYYETSHRIGLYHTEEELSAYTDETVVVDTYTRKNKHTDSIAREIYTASFNLNEDTIAFGNISGGTVLTLYKFASNAHELTGLDVYFSYADTADGIFASIPCAHLLESTLALSAIAPSGNIYVNPFLLKNMYSNNFQHEVRNESSDLSGHITEVPTLLTGLRNYEAVDKTNDAFYLKYKYVREDTVRNALLKNYELIERIAGLYKLSSNVLHKSNIYSIIIENSGLNESLSSTTFRDDIQGHVEDSIREMVLKISPANTQLWKILWKGK